MGFILSRVYAWLGSPSDLALQGTELDKVHFDTRQYNTIVYTNVDGIEVENCNSELKHPR